jgi:hypothetical protein
MEEDEFRLSLKTPYDARKISGRIVLLNTSAHDDLLPAAALVLWNADESSFRVT